MAIVPGALPESALFTKIPTMHLIYLDHNATTPTRPEVIDAIARCLRDGYANPASQHQPGQAARRVVEEARERIAFLLGADSRSDRLLFTSGGTESNNLAILGIARARRPDSPGQIIISAVEHASVLGPAEYLLEQGWRVDTLAVDDQGVVRVDQLSSLFSPATALVSVILGNHETGVLQPLEQIARLCNDHSVPLHTDAVQVAGKLPIDFAPWAQPHCRSPPTSFTDLWALVHSFSATPSRSSLCSTAATSNVPSDPAPNRSPSWSAWRPPWNSGTKTEKPTPNGSPPCATASKPPFTSDTRRWSSIARVPRDCPTPPARPSPASTPKSCSWPSTWLASPARSARPAPADSADLSPTLLAMGLSKQAAGSTLRFSLGATTTEQDIDEAAARIVRVVRELRS